MDPERILDAICESSPTVRAAVESLDSYSRMKLVESITRELPRPVKTDGE